MALLLSTGSPVAGKLCTQQVTLVMADEAQRILETSFSHSPVTVTSASLGNAERASSCKDHWVQRDHCRSMMVGLKEATGGTKELHVCAVQLYQNSPIRISGAALILGNPCRIGQNPSAIWKSPDNSTVEGS